VAVFTTELSQLVRLYDYPASGNCYKARLLLALLEQPYERVPVDIFAGDTLTPEFGRLNPARETPILELDDGEVIVQSNAVLWYLGEGSVYLPADSFDRARVVQWLHFEQEWIARGVGAARFFMLTGCNPELGGARREHGETGLDFLEERLTGRNFLVGDSLSIADISLFAYTHVASDAGIDLTPRTAVRSWIARIAAQPGFIDDYVRYPENARPGRGRSIYDES